MENKKDIGKAFREKLDLLDKSPGNHVWDSIEAELNQKKKRRVIPFWIKVTSIFISALLVFIVTDIMVRDHFYGKDKNPATKETTGGSVTGNQTEANGNGNNDSNNHTDSNNETTKGSESETEGQNNNVSVTTGVTLDKPIDNVNSETSKNSKTSRASSISGNKNKSGNTETVSKKGNKGGKNSINDKVAFSKGKHKKSNANSIGKEKSGKTGKDNFLNQQQTAQQQTAQQQTAKNPELTPTGQSTTGENGSETDLQTKDTGVAAMDSVSKKIEEKKAIAKKQPKDTTKTVEIEEDIYRTFSVFLYAAPTYFNHFSKQSTIDRILDSNPTSSEIVFNYGGYLHFIYDDKWSVRAGIARTALEHTTNDIAVSSLNSNDYYNIEYKTGVNNLFLSQEFEDAAQFEIKQELSYWEIPIELKYNLFRKTISIDAIGGLSTLLIDNNDVTATDDLGHSIYMGRTKNVYMAHFSANLGFGVNYGFARNFQLNVEPMFKYHIKLGDPDLDSYSVLLQAGIEYTFNSKKKTKKVRN